MNDALIGSDFFKKNNSYDQKIRNVFDTVDTNIIANNQSNNSAGFFNNNLTLNYSNNPMNVNLSNVKKTEEQSKDSELTFLDETINEQFKDVQ